jgi:DNA repair protein RadC
MTSPLGESCVLSKEDDMQLSLFKMKNEISDNVGRAIYTPGYRVMIVKDPGLYAPANVSSSMGAAEMFRKLLNEKGSTDREHFMVLMLNGQNMILGFNIAAVGGHNCSQVRMPELFRILLLAGAAAFVVGHNHPSGCCHPSADDISLTREIVKGSKIIRLKLLDHIILADFENYYSFADDGKLKQLSREIANG